MIKTLCISLLAVNLLLCSSQQQRINPVSPLESVQTLHDTTVITIHVLVALCDNKYQGIVPVPAKIGNGQDPDNNLYWGCSYGIRSYFKKSKAWKLVRQKK